MFFAMHARKRSLSKGNTMTNPIPLAVLTDVRRVRKYGDYWIPTKESVCLVWRPDLFALMGKLGKKKEKA